MRSCWSSSEVNYQRHGSKSTSISSLKCKTVSAGTHTRLPLVNALPLATFSPPGEITHIPVQLHTARTSWIIDGRSLPIDPDRVQLRALGRRHWGQHQRQKGDQHHCPPQTLTDGRNPITFTISQMFHFHFDLLQASFHFPKLSP